MKSPQDNLNAWLHHALLAYTASVAGVGEWLALDVGRAWAGLGGAVQQRLRQLWAAEALPRGLTMSAAPFQPQGLVGADEPGLPKLRPDPTRAERWANALWGAAAHAADDTQRSMTQGLVRFVRANHEALADIYRTPFDVLRETANQASVPVREQEGDDLGVTIGQGIERVLAGTLGREFQPLPEDLARDLIDAYPLAGMSWRRRFADLSAEYRKRLLTSVSRGSGLGWSMEETAAEIERQAGVSTQRAMLIARTEVQNLHNRQNELLYRASSGVLAGLRFVATLDPRTCPECARLDGVVYYFSGHPGEPRAPGPRLPFHPNCRCTYAPVTKSWEELGIDLPDAPAEARASWGGPAPARMTFYQWLNLMPRGVIADVLGRTRAEAFIAGVWKPTSLVRGAARRPEALKAAAKHLAAAPSLPAEAEGVVRNVIGKARKNQGVASVRPLSPSEEAAGEEGRGIEVRYRNGGATVVSVDPSSRGETLRQLRLLIRRYRLPGLAR